MRRLPEGLVLLLALLLAAALQACGGRQEAPVVEAPPTPEATTVVLRTSASVLVLAPDEEPKDPLERVEVSPSPVIADPGEAVQLTAQAYSASGALLTEVDLVWTTVDPRAGAVDGQGRFRAGLEPGRFPEAISVTAVRNTPDGIETASALVDVTLVGEERERLLSQVAILPEDPTVVKGQVYRLRAVALDQDGLVLSGADFLWKLNDPRLGELSPIGYLSVEGAEGVYPEAVTVTGLWGDRRATATVDVTVVRTPRAEDYLRVEVLPQSFYLEPGDRLQLRAVALNGLGELVSGTELRWSMVKPEAGVIDGQGNFIAGSIPGVYTEAVRVDAVAPGEQGVVRAVDFASVVIREKPAQRRLAAVQVRPEAIVLSPGGRSVLSVQVVDDRGRPVPETQVSWRLLKPEVGQVDDLGAFVAGDTPGVYPDALEVTVRQVVEGQTIEMSRTVDVTVTGLVASVEIQPSLAVVAPGRTVHFSVLARDENGVVLPGLVVRWSVKDPSVGTIDTFGNFTAAEVSGRFDDVIVAEVVQTVITGHDTPQEKGP